MEDFLLLNISNYIYIKKDSKMIFNDYDNFIGYIKQKIYYIIHSCRKVKKHIYLNNETFKTSYHFKTTI